MRLWLGTALFGLFACSTGALKSLRTPQSDGGDTDPSCPACSVNEAMTATPTGDEAWKNGVKLPRLLRKFDNNPARDLYTPEQICQDVHKNDPQKKLALVVMKTDFCDSGARSCLAASRTSSDPCNKFLQNNFAVYHVRTYAFAKAMPGADEIHKLYGEPGTGAGPTYTVLDVRDCNAVKKFRPVFPSFTSPPGDKAIAHRSSLQLAPVPRFTDMKADLTIEPEVRAILSPAELARSGAELDCSPEERAQHPLYEIKGENGAIDRSSFLTQLIYDQIEAVYGAGFFEALKTHQK